MNIRRIVTISCFAAATIAFYVSPCDAGGGFGFRQNAVGGVMVDAGGVVRNATAAEKDAFLNNIRGLVVSAQGDVAEKTGMRMISLRGLQSAISAALEDGTRLPAEIRYLAGLQRIQYVFVDPENHDIILAGPAEPWKLQDDGSVVGAVTGMPAMVIDDLVTAMQSVERARTQGISCSIEPTAEGMQRLNQLLSRVRLRPGQNPAALEPQMKQAFGPQVIKVSGVPTDSHYARIMVAADYQMKRIAMGLEPSNVAGLPSYIQMARGSITQDNSNPRWWMACNYSSLTRSDDRLSWELSGRGIKTMTETDLLGDDGQVVGRAAADPKAQQWADLMTEHFDELAVRFPVFGQLRNIVDMSVVATLIVQQRLDQQAGLNLDLLLGKGDEVPLTVYTAPQAVSPECSFLRGRRGWIVTTSGGVNINPFEVINSQESSNTLKSVRSQSISVERDRWWWDS